MVRGAKVKAQVGVPLAICAMFGIILAPLNDSASSLAISAISILPLIIKLSPVAISLVTLYNCEL